MVTTGVLQLRASATVIPKFSVYDGRTYRSAPEYSAFRISPLASPWNSTRGRRAAPGLQTRGVGRLPGTDDMQFPIRMIFSQRPPCRQKIFDPLDGMQPAQEQQFPPHSGGPGNLRRQIHAIRQNQHRLLRPNARISRYSFSQVACSISARKRLAYCPSIRLTHFFHRDRFSAQGARAAPRADHQLGAVPRRTNSG